MVLMAMMSLDTLLAPSLPWPHSTFTYLSTLDSHGAVEEKKLLRQARRTSGSSGSSDPHTAFVERQAQFGQGTTHEFQITMGWRSDKCYFGGSWILKLVSSLLSIAYDDPTCQTHRRAALGSDTTPKKRWKRAAFLVGRLKANDDLLSGNGVHVEAEDKHLETQHWLELIDAWVLNLRCSHNLST